MVLKKIDFLTFGFLIITGILILCGGWHPNQTGMLLLVRLLSMVGAIIVIYWHSKQDNRFTGLLRIAYPLILTGYYYQETVHYNKLFFQNLDPVVSHVERIIFGCQPSLEFSRLMPMSWFSELMYFGYFSYYLIIIGFCIALFYQKSEHLTRCIFLVTSSFFLFYLIFAIVPVCGPQFYFRYPYNVVPNGYIFEHLVRSIQESGEQPTGAFPSSHVGLSVIILFLSAKYAYRYFLGILPIVVFLILSTVYIKAHYLVDVVGAFLVFPSILWISHLLYRYLPGDGE
ncbi:MAG: phosphatase PAP2 family protein [Bacteroidota bacterium]|nr:phosphatase PAP2 family protein [Bacteroidota bacterium]MDP4205750.1 phosphatase PAP2 family protein [Bacteroidota bacterium]